MPTRLLAFGSNSSGQLGIGNHDDTSIPQACRFTSDWQHGEEIQDIAAGGNHTLLLTSTGRVFAAGSNGNGQCGLGDSVEGCNHFELIRNICGDDVGQGVVTHIAATWEASLFVLDKQKVYSCGAGSKGELGLGPETALTKVSRLVLDLSTNLGTARVARLTAAMSHVVLLTDDGRLLGWGASRKGQLGHEAMVEKSITLPRSISSCEPICCVAAGRDFTYVLHGSGRGQILGQNSHLGDAAALSVQPGDVICAGWTHLFAWNEERLVGVGRDNHGQLPPTELVSPRLVATGSEHSLALTREGQVLAWGWGEHGNCGPPSHEGKNGANEIELKGWRDEVVSFIAAGCATSFIALTATD